MNYRFHISLLGSWSRFEELKTTMYSFRRARKIKKFQTLNLYRVLEGTHLSMKCMFVNNVYEVRSLSCSVRHEMHTHTLNLNNLFVIKSRLFSWNYFMDIIEVE